MTHNNIWYYDDDRYLFRHSNNIIFLRVWEREKKPKNKKTKIRGKTGKVKQQIWI